MGRVAVLGGAGLTWWVCGRAAVFVAQGTWMDDVTRGDRAAERRVGRWITATGPVGLVGQLAALIGFSAVVGIGSRIADAIDRRRT